MFKRFIIYSLLISMLLSTLVSCVNPPETSGETGNNTIDTQQGTQDPTGEDPEKKLDFSCLELVSERRKETLITEFADIRFTSAYENETTLRNNSVRFPLLISEREGAKALNGKLKQLFEDNYSSLETYNGGHKSSSEYVLDVSYEYSYFAGVLSLIIIEEKIFPDKTIVKNAEFFAYDAVSDNEMTLSDVLSLFGITKNELFSEAVSYLPEGDIIGVSMLLDGSFAVYCGTESKYGGMFYSVPFDSAYAKDVLERRFVPSLDVLADVFYKLPETEYASRFMICAPSFEKNGARQVRKDIIDWFYSAYSDDAAQLPLKYYEKLAADDIMYDISGSVYETGDILTYRMSDSSALCSGITENSETSFYYDKEADIGIKNLVSAEKLVYELDADEFTPEFLKYYSDSLLGGELSKVIDLILAFKDESGKVFGVRLEYEYFGASYPHAYDYNAYIFGKAIDIFSSLGAAAAVGEQSVLALEEKDVLYFLDANNKSNGEKDIFTSDVCFYDRAKDAVEADSFYFDRGALSIIGKEDYLKLFDENTDDLKKETAEHCGVPDSSFTVSYVFINEYNNDTEVYGVSDGRYGLLCKLTKPMEALEKLEKERKNYISEIVATAYEKEFYTLKGEGDTFRNIFRVPEIAVGSNNAASLNKKIMTDFNELFKEFIDENGTLDMKKTDIGGFYSYEYVYEEGIIAIECRYVQYDFSADSGGEVKKKYYYYDTDRKREITAEQYNSSSLLAKNGMLTDLSELSDIIGKVVIADSGMVRTLFEFTINAPIFATDGSADNISSRVMIPFINSERPGAASLNKKIVDDFVSDYDDVISSLLEAERKGSISGNNVYEISYDYRVEGCYIVIERVNICAALPNGYRKDIVYYYYDYENDVILTKLPDDTEDYLKLPISELKVKTLSSVAESLLSSDHVVFPVKNKKYKAVENDELVRVELTIPCVNGSFKGAELMNDEIISDILNSFRKFVTLDETHKLADINALKEVGVPFGYVGHTYDERNGVISVDYLKPGKALSDVVYVVRYLDAETGKVITQNEYLSKLGESKKNIISELEKIDENVKLLGNSDFTSDAIVKYSAEEDGDISVYLRHDSGELVKVLLERNTDEEKRISEKRSESVSSLKESKEKVYVRLDAEKKYGIIEDSVWKYVYHRVPELVFSSEDGERINQTVRNKFDELYLASVSEGRGSSLKLSEGVKVMNYRYSRIGDLFVLTLIEETVSDVGTEKSYEHIYYDAAYHKLMTYDEFKSAADSNDAHDLFDVAVSRNSNELYIYIVSHLERVLKESENDGNIVLPMIEFQTEASGKLPGDHVSIIAVNDISNGINRFNMTLLTEFYREYESALRDVLKDINDGFVTDVSYKYTENKGYITIVGDAYLSEKDGASKETVRYYFDLKKKVQITETDAYVLDNFFEPDIDEIISKAADGRGGKVKQAYGKEFFVYYTDKKYVVNYFHFPILNVNSENAVNFNRKILTELFDEHLGYINKYSLLQRADTSSFFLSVDYEYSIKDNIIIISVESRRFLFDDSESDTKYRLYYYDTEKDKELTTEEYLANFGMSSDMILNELNSGKFAGFTAGEYGGLYKFKLSDLDGVVAFGEGNYDIYLKTSDDESTIKISYPPINVGEWNAFPMYDGAERNKLTGIHFIHENWNATKRSCVFDDVISDEEYKLYDVGNGIVCIYYSRRGYSGFALYDLTSAETVYVYDTAVEEILKLHGIDYEDYAGSTHLDINVDSVTSYMVICSYDLGVIFDNNDIRTEVSLRGKFAASVYTGETVFYPGAESVKLSNVDFLASRIDEAENKDELKKLAEDTAKSLSLGDIVENSYTDENGSIYDFVVGGVTFAYEEVKNSSGGSETAVSLTVAENISQLLPHGIKLGDSLDTVLSVYGYDAKASDISSLTYIDGTVVDETHAFVSFDEGGYYLVWEKVNDRECRRIMLAFNETLSDDGAYPLSYVQYLLIRL